MARLSDPTADARDLSGDTAETTPGRGRQRRGEDDGDHSAADAAADRFEQQSEFDRYEGFMPDLVDRSVGKYNGSLKVEHGTGLAMAPVHDHLLARLEELTRAAGDPR